MNREKKFARYYLESLGGAFSLNMEKRWKYKLHKFVAAFN